MTELTPLQQKMADMKAAAATPAVDPALKEPVSIPTSGLEIIPDEPEKVFHVFYHTLPNCNMTIPTGGRVSFVNHRYVTDQQHEINHLQTEIARGNHRLSILKGQETMTSTELDPMASMKKQYFEEFKALQAEAARKIASGEPLSQSESEVIPLTPGSTSDIASLAADSGQ